MVIANWLKGWSKMRSVGLIGPDNEAEDIEMKVLSTVAYFYVGAMTVLSISSIARDHL